MAISSLRRAAVITVETSDHRPVVVRFGLK